MVILGELQERPSFVVVRISCPSFFLVALGCKMPTNSVSPTGLNVERLRCRVSFDGGFFFSTPRTAIVPSVPRARFFLKRYSPLAEGGKGRVNLFSRAYGEPAEWENPRLAGTRTKALLPLPE